ncbi:MAG: GNAT family N-acetyltransferase [Anaerolineae bacterium]|nr:MAG: GNAT family N-acetyltransferase [Anaerolineae bacterium]
MSHTIEMIETLPLPDASLLPGLSFRRFQGESDYPNILAVINGMMRTDGIQNSATLEDIANNYQHLINCDPYQDMLFAELKGEVQGYGRIWWMQEENGLRRYITLLYLLPALREDAIGHIMADWFETRLRQKAAADPVGDGVVLEVFASDKQPWISALWDARGYDPVRYGFDMVRDLGQPILDVPCPPGIQVRPITEDMLRTCWDASQEAFRDHWGYVPPTESQYEGWLKEVKDEYPLWKVGFAGEEIAGQVQNFINKEENAEFNRLRGYTEGISTRRPWRKMGLARYLLTESMKMFEEMGMTETALAVDAENPNGALQLYESVGYRVVLKGVTYRKPVTSE